jgi:arabinoxylan arabinofuranohydrolase
MPAQGSSFTNHPGVIDFKGSSYFFYHNGALPGGGGFTRSVAVEKFTYNADGTIPQMNMTTAGPPQVGPSIPMCAKRPRRSPGPRGSRPSGPPQAG